MSAVLAVVAVACGGPKQAPVMPTPPPPAVDARPVATPAGQTAAQKEQTPAQDPVVATISAAERHFELGLTELKAGRLTRARAEFDRAVGVLIEFPGGAKSEPRLRAEYDQLLNRIAALEAAALRQGDGFSETRSEGAIIDDLLAVATFPRATAKTQTAVAEELEAAAYDLPIVSNDKVLSYVELFQGGLRGFLEKGLARGSRYLPRIREVFQAEGVPLDLAYVPLIESAYMSQALSRARAKGMWQFQLPTAKDYGLRYNWFIDERSDFEKSTVAAAKHFKMLANMFNGDWNLALASYNVGQGFVLGAVKRAKTSDYWQLSASTKYLPRDTREYVPMIWAAIIIAKNPQQFGFDLETQPPLAYDVVRVPDAISLATVAEWIDSSVDALRDLNPELRRNTTPMGEHDLRVPVGTKAALEEKLAVADPTTFSTFIRHTVKSGETIATIANRYKIKRADLADANGLKTTAKLLPGQSLLVPGAAAAVVTSARTAPAAPSTESKTPAKTTTPAKAPAAASKAPAPATKAPATNGKAPAATTGTPVTYKVKKGDTLSSIAKQFSVTIDDLKKWNNLSTSALSIGKALKVYRN